MELFESELLDQNQGQSALAVEPEPRYQPATATLPLETNEHGHAWIRTIGLILIGLILVVAIVLLARWAYHRTHQSSTKTPSKVSTSTKLSDQANRPTADSESSNPSSSNHPAPSPPSSDNIKITNTGPGNVVGLFVGTSLAVAGLHFVVNLRRFNRA